MVDLRLDRYKCVSFQPPQAPPETIDFPQATGNTSFAGNRFRGSLPRNNERRKTVRLTGIVTEEACNVLRSRMAGFSADFRHLQTRVVEHACISQRQSMFYMAGLRRPVSLQMRRARLQTGKTT